MNFPIEIMIHHILPIRRQLILLETIIKFEEEYEEKMIEKRKMQDELQIYFFRGMEILPLEIRINIVFERQSYCLRRMYYLSMLYYSEYIQQIKKKPLFPSYYYYKIKHILLTFCLNRVVLE